MNSIIAMANKNILLNSKKKKAIELIQKNQFAEARTLYAEICASEKNDADAWFTLGVINGKLNRVAESIESFRKAILLQPAHALAHYNLGMAARSHGRTEEAAIAFKEAVRLAPQRPEPYVGLGQMLMSLGRMDEAVSCLRSLLKLAPHDAEALANLGRILHAQGHLEDAVACYRKVLNIQPRYASVYDNLGSALCDQGFFTEAVANHRKALSIAPNDAIAHSNLLLTSLYIPQADQHEIFAEHRRWAQAHAKPSSGSSSFSNNRDPERRLRIGYVSADFRAHSVTFFFEPLLAHHDRNNVEVVCYSNVARPDAVTERLQKIADQWRNIASMGDEQAASTIRTDEIDILVDLSGHTGGNRLKVFALRPAPIQATYLGYPNTTGLPTMDYRMTDNFADPEGQDAYFTEKLVRLPGGFLCYQPLSDAPPVSPLPALERGHVTFGSFNNLSKINEGVVNLWARLLEMVPDSRLFIKSPSLTDAAAREHYYELFSKRGAARERVELRGRTETQSGHLALYSRLDVALDTFPYNGTTTTCEAIWMGVPVISLVGDGHAGRVGASLMNSAGMTDWLAESQEQYIALAANLASDIPRLAALRASLRERMAGSSLCDAKTFASQLERTYREMWRAWVRNNEK